MVTKFYPVKAQLMNLILSFAFAISSVTYSLAGSGLNDVASLPFFEDWSSGSFSRNGWTAGENWVVYGQMGTPLPAVKFQWNPPQSSYNSSLESRWFETPSKNAAVNSKIWLDFNLALSDKTSSGNEKMVAEVWGGENWIAVAILKNNGSFSWKTQHIDITGKVRGNAFKIRFTAMGDDSKDIINWMIDNISLKVAENSSSSQTLPEVQQNDVPLNNADASRDLVGYNIYRRQYLDPMPGGWTILSPWSKINFSPITVREYWDLNVPYNCYDYYVTAVYTEGESGPSNIDAWNCPYEGVGENEAPEIRLYPNPATTYINMEFSYDMRNINIYNALGLLIFQKNIENDKLIILQTGNWAAGAYIVKFMDADRNCVIRKFFVVK